MGALRGGIGALWRGIHACLRLRVLTGDYVAASVEQGSKAHTLSAKMRKAPEGAFQHFGGEGGIRTHGTV